MSLSAVAIVVAVSVSGLLAIVYAAKMWGRTEQHSKKLESVVRKLEGAHGAYAKARTNLARILRSKLPKSR